jgi:hypothetical protein
LVIATGGKFGNGAKARKMKDSLRGVRVIGREVKGGLFKAHEQRRKSDGEALGSSRGYDQWQFSGGKGEVSRIRA